MQDEIAAAVVAALKVKLLHDQPPVVSQHRTSNPEAYNQYLLGRRFFSLSSVDGFRRAAAVYEKAIELDPSYAAAYAGLAKALNMQVDFAGSAVEQAANRGKALWAAEQAVLLDPMLAEGYAARANARAYGGYDWAGAQADFAQALSLHPGDPTMHAYYGRLLARTGRLPEAIAEATKAIELDPLYAGGHNILGWFLCSSGQLPEARRVLTRALEISPDNEWGHFFFGITALLQRDPTAALSGLAPFTTPRRKAILVLAERDLGHANESRRALDDLIAKHGETDAYRIAEVYAWSGDTDRAFEWLDRAHAQRDSQLPTLTFDPLVAGLRGDPRYKAMVKKLNLPEGR
jgi:tetratricopeptide (TPR) repeat protein